MPPWRSLLFAAFFFSFLIHTSVLAQDYEDDQGGDDKSVQLPKAAQSCNGIFITYDFLYREREYPYVKNATAQAYAFRSTATVLNTMTEELKSWNIFVGFQHREILVSASGAVITDGTDFPAHVENGTSFSGSPQADLLDAVDTAGDLHQMMVKIEISGTQFGVKPPGIPMPKTIKLQNEGFKCPKATRKGSQMYVCCVKDKKSKSKKLAPTKFLPRRYGDLTIDYDVLQAFENNYLAQVSLDSNHPLGRLDNWNLTWEWKRGEFINTMRGAYTLKHDPSECIYGEAGKYYKNFDFSNVMSCQKKPIIADLPPERANDTQIGKIPYCCKNGTLLPPTMDTTKSKAVFQLQVFKMPPDFNRTALYPPQNWKITGQLNPEYTCGPPFRVSPMEFPDPSGLMAKSYAIASWQVVCNISRPAPKKSRCCVSFSAYYNDSVVPCSSCACGCPDTDTCDPDARAALLPPEALLLPSENRTAKAKAWAKIKHFDLPNPMPCWDTCGVSINWHIVSDYRNGWSARITIFNWEEYTFRDWFSAVQMPRAYDGFDKVYSFNGTKLTTPQNTIFFRGLEGLNYLLPETDGKNPEKDPRLPGKQQSVITFTKRHTPGIDIPGGDGFPTRVFFNGGECSLPDEIPRGDGHRPRASLLLMALAALVVFASLMGDLF
ncbi:COBRA-like protein 10 [Phoenix dactylifera]|uniref:COBRA-like protein 10 n=1 Tax=Phoenix dactylifera TaxID=42345 RepID=A0A8B7BZ17_PHODC|nr:COBRA-like protein 10 [Phoenix dactylifera]